MFKFAGAVSSYSLIKIKNKNYIYCNLFFIKNFPLFYNFKIVSKPGKPILISYFSLNLISKKMGLSSIILSTPKGIIFIKEALKNKQGGELIGYF